MGLASSLSLCFVRYRLRVLLPQRLGLERSVSLCVVSPKYVRIVSLDSCSFSVFVSCKLSILCLVSSVFYVLLAQCLASTVSLSC